MRIWPINIEGRRAIGACFHTCVPHACTSTLKYHISIGCKSVFLPHIWCYSPLWLSGVTLKTLTMWLSIDHTRSLRLALMMVLLMFFMAWFTLILIRILLLFPWKFLEGIPAQMEEVSTLIYSLLFFYYCSVVSALKYILFLSNTSILYQWCLQQRF